MAPERPGHGLSDFQSRRTLLDWAHDVEVLADSLHLDRFATMGVSGGGPYAAATAYQLPERVTKAAFVSSVGPLTFSDATAGMLPSGRLLFRLARSAPWAANLMMKNMARGTNKPERVRKHVLRCRSLPSVDVAVLQDDEVWNTLVVLQSHLKGSS